MRAHSTSLDYDQLLNLAAGRWRGEVADITCPACSAGRSTAAHRKKRVLRLWRRDGFISFNCARCGIAGHVLDGAAPPDPVKIARFQVEAAERQLEDDLARQRRALAVWDAASDLAGTVALDYLTRGKATGGRALDVPEGMSGRVLRFHPRCPWRDDDDSPIVKVPALIALYRDIITDQPKAILRCALTLAGYKRGRKAYGPKAGCAIKLTADEDVEQGLHVGEGVETMLAAMMLGFSPAWALGDTSGVGAIPVLAGIDALAIIVDRDANGAGQDAASTCFDRWTAAGREVWTIVPDAVGADLNDIVAGAA
jgi:Toprim domain